MSSLTDPARSTRRIATRLAVPALALAAVTACNPLEPVTPPTGSTPKPTVPASSATGVQAKSADSLVNAYGVNIHLTYGGTPYTNVTATGNALNELGARHVRDRIHNNPTQWAAINNLSARGIRFNLIMGAPGQDNPAELVKTVATKVPKAAETLEGANEWNLKRRPNWVAELKAHQTALWKASKANPTTARLPVLSPSLGSKQDFTKLGNIAGLSNYGNIHNYPGGRLPSTDIATTMANARINSGNQPIMTTETQYQNALNTTNGHKPTSEKAAGIYAPRLLLENYSRGISRMFNYELFDQRVDPSKTDIEMNFGLIRTNGTRKPAFTAMSNLLKLLADPGPSFQAGRLDYKIAAGAPTDLRQTLVQKRDGAFYLVLWRDVSVWDQVARKDLNPAVKNVTVNLGRSAPVATFQPSTQKAATKTVAATKSVTVPLAGQAVVLRVG